MENVSKKVEILVDTTQRMRRDAERVRLQIERLTQVKPREHLNEIEEKLWDIDDVNAEICAIVAYLSTIQMMLFSGEYPPEIFELANFKKSDFGFQVSNLLSYYKTISFSVQEMSKTVRTIYEYHSQLSLMRNTISLQKGKDS